MTNLFSGKCMKFQGLRGIADLNAFTQG